MDEMAYQVYLEGMASLGLLEWQGRRESQDIQELKVRIQDLADIFPSLFQAHTLPYHFSQNEQKFAGVSTYQSYSDLLGLLQKMPKCDEI